MRERSTPETDTETMRDEYDHVDTDFGPFAPSDTVPADFARCLERERDEAREALEFRRGLYKLLEEANSRLVASNKEAVALARTLKQERDEARKYLKWIHDVADSQRKWNFRTLAKEGLMKSEAAK